MKKFFTLVCLAVFVASFAACGGPKGDGVRAGVKEKGAPSLSETAYENAQTEVY